MKYRYEFYVVNGKDFFVETDMDISPDRFLTDKITLPDQSLSDMFFSLVPIVLNNG